MPILVKFCADWADEFYCEEYRIVETSIEDVTQSISRLIKREAWFGTNEGFNENELSTSDFEIFPISDEEANVLKRFFGDSFGVGILSDLFYENDEDEDFDADKLGNWRDD